MKCPACGIQFDDNMSACPICGQTITAHYRAELKTIKELEDQKKKLEKEIKEKEQKQKELDSKKYKPKCPTCDSENVERITTFDRALSFGVFGFWSGSIGKNYRCRNCKHKW